MDIWAHAGYGAVVIIILMMVWRKRKTAMQRNLVAWVLGLLSLFRLLQPTSAIAQGWEIDWDAVERIGNAVASEIQASPLADQILALSNRVEVDWELVGKLVDEVLDGSSWELAAEVRPLAERALLQLEQLEGGALAAAWFRQRLDYLQVAEGYVKQAKRSPVSRPRNVPVHTVQLDADTQQWIRRLPAEPRASAKTLVPGLRRRFEAEGVPSALLWVAEVESSFNPSARSPVGAAGLYQFMPATAQSLGLSLQPVDQRLDPLLSATAAARYLKRLHRRFADWPLALAAYNAGQGRVGKLLRNQRVRSFEAIADRLPVETRMYVPRIAAVVKQREGLELSQLPSPTVP